MNEMFDGALSLYLSTNKPPKKTVAALDELREQLNTVSDVTESLGSIRQIGLQKGGNAGVVAVLFQVNPTPPGYWKHELSQTLRTALGINFQRVGIYQTANWKEGIEVAIS